MNQHEIESELKSLRECMNESYQRQDDLEKQMNENVKELASLRLALETFRQSVTVSLAENTTVLRQLCDAMLGSFTDRKKIGLIAEHEAMMTTQDEIVKFHAFVKKWSWMILGATAIVSGGIGAILWQLLKAVTP